MSANIDVTQIAQKLVDEIDLALQKQVEENTLLRGMRKGVETLYDRIRQANTASTADSADSTSSEPSGTAEEVANVAG